MQNKTYIILLNIILLNSCDFLSNNENNKQNNLLAEMWHFKSTGQKSYTKNSALMGLDLNLPNSKYSGKNVKILIADDAVDLKHPDLVANAIPNGSLDLYNDIFTPVTYLPISQNTETHGTKVAGIIAASKNKQNNFRGIAFNANIGSANLFDKASSVFSYSAMQMFMYDFAYSQNIDIINQSYGENPFIYSALLSSNYNTIHAIIKEKSKVTDNKGFIIVTSAGNYTCEFKYADKYSEATGRKVNYETATKIDTNLIKDLQEHEIKYLSRIRAHLSLFDWKKSSPYAIVVGALAANGIIAEYSSIGSNLWITGFGGGESSRKKDDLLFHSDTQERPKIITTNIPGRIGFGNLFDSGFLQENKELLYSSTFSGTSAAAPTVTGVVALILAANPKLSLWDVKHILAKTATQKGIELNPKPFCIKIIEKLNIFNTENSLWSSWNSGWTKNAAGYNFSNFYGFGVVNAADAVEYASHYDNPYSGKKIESVNYKNYTFNKIIIEGSSENSILMNIDKNLKIQAINIYPIIETNKADGLAIELESPQHTKSIILYPGNSLISSDRDNVDLKYPGSEVNLAENNIGFLSNAFYEENSAGTWKLKIINANKKEQNKDNKIIFKGLKIEILGYAS